MRFAKEIRRQQDRERMYKWHRATFWLSREFRWTPTVIDHWTTTTPVIAQYGRIGEWHEFITYHSMN